MDNPIIMTVRGAIKPEELGATLPHEHVLHTFGEPATTAPDYDPEHVMQIALPALEGIKALGVDALVECTTEYFGRDVEKLRTLSEKSSVHILTNTGYYGAAEDRYVPEFAYEETAAQLAARWVQEWEQGIKGTGIKPGFIKIGVDNPGPLSEIDAKLVRAAAKTHLQTGLAMAIHTPQDATLAWAELDILAEEGVHPSAWIWVHADTVEDFDAVVAAARAGAWIEFDKINADNVAQPLALCWEMKAKGLLGRLLLSHDESSYAKERTAPEEVHVTVFRELLPKLKAAGFMQAEIEQITMVNPRAAFTVRVRAAG
ncbi:MAG: phosphotriesterase [Anaerolineales bacterium]|nr:phosphotriesterase [Anaerolineales bacterium]